MRKIDTLFLRGENFKVTQQVTNSCEWVLKGEGVATEKLDGTNVMVVFHLDGQYSIHKRSNPSKEEKKLDIQPINIPIDPSDKNDQYSIEAVDNFINKYPNHGLYGVIYGEVIGEKIQTNRYDLDYRIWIPFVPPYITIVPDIPRTYKDLKKYLTPERESIAYPGHPIEGIVFHNWYSSAKIKVEDFYDVDPIYKKRR